MMDVVVWMLTALLAAAFLAAGTFKLVRPVPALQAAGMGWPEDVAPRQVKLIGALEPLGAIGLVLPWLLDTARWLTRRSPLRALP